MAMLYRNPYGKEKVDLNGIRIPVAFKNWAVERLVSRKRKAKNIAKKYNLVRSTVQSWATRANKGVILSEGPGRHKKISAKGLSEIGKFMDDSVMDVRSSDYLARLQQAAEQTALERGQSTTGVHLSRNTILRASKALGVTNGLAEATTNARIVGCGEIRNQVSLAAMTLSTPEIDQRLVLNFDSSGFTVGGKGADDVEIKYVKEEKGAKKKINRTAPSRGRQVSPDPDDQGFTRYTIKYVLLMCAGGFQAAPIYVLADDNMGEEEFRSYKAKGLGVGTNLDSHGHVVIMKNRTGNAAFHRWLLTSVMIPWVEDLKKYYDIGADKWAALNIDGEPTQMPVIFEPEIQALLEAHKIIVGKFPASTTSINQPCDARNAFRAPKTQNKKIANKDVKSNTFLMNVVVQIFKQHNEWLNSDERGDERHKGKPKRYQSKKKKKIEIAMNSAHLTLGKYGLLRIQLALQLCMRPHMIRESFQATGLYPVDAKKILSNCHHRITREEELHIMHRMPELIQLFKTQGEVFESDFDRLGIQSTKQREGKGLDGLILYRRRAIILTHKDVVRRQAEYVTIKEAAEEKASKKRKVALTITVEVSQKKMRFFFKD